MSYTEELEKQNEELREKLTVAETRIHNITRDYTSDDVFTNILNHEKSFVNGLIKSAEQLLQRGDGTWCDRADRLEYYIRRTRLHNSSFNDKDTLSMKIKCEEQTFFEKLLRKKPIPYIELKLELCDPFGGDGYTRVYDKEFIDIVRNRSITAMFHTIDEFQSKRSDAMNFVIAEIQKRIDICRNDGSLLYKNKIQRITDALNKIS